MERYVSREEPWKGDGAFGKVAGCERHKPPFQNYHPPWATVFKWSAASLARNLGRVMVRSGRRLPAVIHADTLMKTTTHRGRQCSNGALRLSRGTLEGDGAFGKVAGCERGNNPIQNYHPPWGDSVHLERCVSREEP